MKTYTVIFFDPKKNKQLTLPIKFTAKDDTQLGYQVGVYMHTIPTALVPGIETRVTPRLRSSKQFIWGMRVGARDRDVPRYFSGMNNFDPEIIQMKLNKAAKEKEQYLKLHAPLSAVTKNAKTKLSDHEQFLKSLSEIFHTVINGEKVKLISLEEKARELAQNIPNDPIKAEEASRNLSEIMQEINRYKMDPYYASPNIENLLKNIKHEPHVKDEPHVKEEAISDAGNDLGWDYNDINLRPLFDEGGAIFGGAIQGYETILRSIERHLGLSHSGHAEQRLAAIGRIFPNIKNINLQIKIREEILKLMKISRLARKVLGRVPLAPRLEKSSETHFQNHSRITPRILVRGNAGVPLMPRSNVNSSANASPNINIRPGGEDQSTLLRKFIELANFSSNPKINEEKAKEKAHNLNQLADSGQLSKFHKEMLDALNNNNSENIQIIKDHLNANAANFLQQQEELARKNYGFNEEKTADMLRELDQRIAERQELMGQVVINQKRDIDEEFGKINVQIKNLEKGLEKQLKSLKFEPENKAMEWEPTIQRAIAKVDAFNQTEKPILANTHAQTDYQRANAYTETIRPLVINAQAQTNNDSGLQTGFQAERRYFVEHPPSEVKSLVFSSAPTSAFTSPTTQLGERKNFNFTARIPEQTRNLTATVATSTTALPTSGPEKRMPLIFPTTTLTNPRNVHSRKLTSSDPTTELIGEEERIKKLEKILQEGSNAWPNNEEVEKWQINQGGLDTNMESEIITPAAIPTIISDVEFSDSASNTGRYQEKHANDPPYEPQMSNIEEQDEEYVPIPESVEEEIAASQNSGNPLPVFQAPIEEKVGLETELPKTGFVIEGDDQDIEDEIESILDNPDPKTLKNNAVVNELNTRHLINLLDEVMRYVRINKIGHVNKIIGKYTRGEKISSFERNMLQEAYDEALNLKNSMFETIEKPKSVNDNDTNVDPRKGASRAKSPINELNARDYLYLIADVERFVTPKDISLLKKYKNYYREGKTLTTSQQKNLKNIYENALERSEQAKGSGIGNHLARYLLSKHTSRITRMPAKSLLLKKLDRFKQKHKIHPYYINELIN